MACRIALLGLLLLGGLSSVQALSVPAGFEVRQVFSDLQGIFCVRFAPDGRMFLSEWRRGYLRIATQQADGSWQLLSEPFHRFSTPDNPASGTGNARRGTLRSFDFDPDFASNGRIYATYMHENERNGYRVVRIQASGNANRSTGNETLLFRLPYADNAQPDAHNGGGLVIGGDGKLYVSTGDGWGTSRGMDPIQRLDTFTGKVIRINLDGSIPSSNPFYNQANGVYRAIYALGLRNPTCLSRHPVSGAVYAHSVQGGKKDSLYLLRAGDNYGHGGSSSIGTQRDPWLRTAIDNGVHVWGAWYPPGGSWGAAFEGSCFGVNWKGKEIIKIPSANTPSKEQFIGGAAIGNLAVACNAFGPDGHLYYTVREYGETTHLFVCKKVDAGDQRPSLRWSVVPGDVVEGDSPRLVIQRDGPTAAALDVDLSTAGTAASNDFSGLPARVRMDAGQTQTEVVLDIVDDSQHEGVETLHIDMVSNPSYLLGSPSRATMRIAASDEPLRQPDAPAQVAAGISYEYFHLSNPASVAELDALTPLSTGVMPTIGIAGAQRADQFGFRFIGFFLAEQDGSYQFSTESDDGSSLHIGTAPLVLNDGRHGSIRREGTIGLAAGLHAIAVRYFEHTGGQTLRVRYRGPGMSQETDLPANLLSHVPNTDPYGLTSRGSIGAYLNGRLPSNAAQSPPARLSQTGAFVDLAARRPVAGVIPFAVNSPLWSDGARKQRWFAVPDGQRLQFSATGSWDWPAGSVTIKHFSLPADAGDPTIVIPLETRFNVKVADGSWYGITYKWRSDGSDADLVAASGASASYTVRNTDGSSRQQRWDFPSRADCLQCHNASAGFTLGINTRQLNGSFTYPSTGVRDNQLRTLAHIDVFSNPPNENSLPALAALVAVSDASGSLEHRVRSYLDSNCSQCHRPGGPGNGLFDARFDTALVDQGLIDGPVQESVGRDGARVIKPRDRWRSMMHHRMQLRDDPLQMPALGSRLPDEEALAVFVAYIDSLPGTIALAPAQLSPVPGQHAHGTRVQASHVDAQAALRYRLDGQVPRATDPIWPNNGLVLLDEVDLRVNAWRSGRATSVAVGGPYRPGPDTTAPAAPLDLRATVVPAAP